MDQWRILTKKKTQQNHPPEKLGSDQIPFEKLWHGMLHSIHLARIKLPTCDFQNPIHRFRHPSTFMRSAGMPVFWGHAFCQHIYHLYHKSRGDKHRETKKQTPGCLENPSPNPPPAASEGCRPSRIHIGWFIRPPPAQKKVDAWIPNKWCCACAKIPSMVPCSYCEISGDVDGNIGSEGNW